MAMTRGWILALLLWSGLAAAAEPPPDTRPPPPVEALGRLLQDEKVKHAFELMAEPEVRQWLATRPAVAEDGLDLPDMGGVGLVATLDGFRTRLGALGRAAAALPREIADGHARLMRDAAAIGSYWALGYILIFVLGGFGAERLCWLATAGWRRMALNARPATARQRVLFAFGRLSFWLVHLAVFAAGSIGAFLLFRWPPLVGQLILGYLSVLLAVRLTLQLGYFALAPRVERFRLIPMSNDEARFWRHWSALLVGIAMAGYQCVDLFQRLGMGGDSLDVLAQAFGLVGGGLAISALWLARPLARTRSGGNHLAIPLLASVIVPTIWFLFLVGYDRLGWFLTVLAGVPLILRVTGAALRALLRPERGADALEQELSSAYHVVAERGWRVIVLIGAILLLARAWRIDLEALTSNDGMGSRLLRGGLNALVILLIADLIWQLIRVVIDTRIEGATLGEALEG